jgi:phosphorylcholine metabolism protein LicD
MTGSMSARKVMRATRRATRRIKNTCCKFTRTNTILKIFMTKEHWKTKEKRLRMEAEAQTETVEQVQEEVQVLKEQVKILEVGYNIYNARAELVEFVRGEVEAEETLKKYPNGFKRISGV